MTQTKELKQHQVEKATPQELYDRMMEKGHTNIFTDKKHTQEVIGDYIVVLEYGEPVPGDDREKYGVTAWRKTNTKHPTGLTQAYRDSEHFGLYYDEDKAKKHFNALVKEVSS